MVRTRSADSQLWQEPSQNEEERNCAEADMWRQKYETDAAPLTKVIHYTFFVYLFFTLINENI